MTRTRLPERHPAQTSEIEHGGLRFAVTVGFYPDGRPGEVFTHGARSGSAIDGRRYEYALSVIAWRLNGRRAPRKRSQQFVIGRARDVSRTF
jgi:hypothetical protein